jgi:acyl-CoA thioester hydrolase
MQTLWRGNANAWECDELGHLNVRFYLAKATEAVGALAQKIAMPDAFTANAMATLIARSVTLRFLAEVQPGAPLAIRGGVLHHDDTGLTAALILDHCAKDRPAAAFKVRLAHYAPDFGRVFPWSARTRAALDALTIDAPAEIAARSLSSDPPEQDVSLERADALGLEEVGRGMINPQEVDALGRMRAEFAFGKISSSVVHLETGFPEQWAAFRDGRPLEAASAVLEARLHFHRWPTAGTGYVIRTGLARVTDKVRTLVHWVCDPATGGPLWTMEAVGCLMDLKARRLKPADPETLARMRAAVIDGLKA